MDNRVGNSRENTIAVMALQHLLVSKQILTFAEISDANDRANKLLNSFLTKLESATPETHAQITVEFLAAIAEFIGGAEAKLAIDQVSSKLQEELNKSTKV